MKITKTTKEQKSEILEAGDVISTNTDTLFLLVRDSHDCLGLMNLEDYECDFQFTHSVHIINWLKKHHGEFTLIKKNELELIIPHD
jgi:hypothetical protein